METGSYVGDGAAKRELPLDFSPAVLWLTFDEEFRSGYGGMVLSDASEHFPTDLPRLR